MYSYDHRKFCEQIVAAALLKAFSDEISPESRIMLGKYSRQIRFIDQDCRAVQTAFNLNVTPDAVDNPDLIWNTAELMGVDCTELLDIYVLTQELYQSIVYLTGAVFDLGEIIEHVALRYGD